MTAYHVLVSSTLFCPARLCMVWEIKHFIIEEATHNNMMKKDENSTLVCSFHQWSGALTEPSGWRPNPEPHRSKLQNSHIFLSSLYLVCIWLMSWTNWVAAWNLDIISCHPCLCMCPLTQFRFSICSQYKRQKSAICCSDQHALSFVAYMSHNNDKYYMLPVQKLCMTQE